MLLSKELWESMPSEAMASCQNLEVTYEKKEPFPYFSLDFLNKTFIFI